MIYRQRRNEFIGDDDTSWGKSSRKTRKVQSLSQRVFHPVFHTRLERVFLCFKSERLWHTRPFAHICVRKSIESVEFQTELNQNKHSPLDTFFTRYKIQREIKLEFCLWQVGVILPNQCRIHDMWSKFVFQPFKWLAVGLNVRKYEPKAWNLGESKLRPVKVFSMLFGENGSLPLPFL